MKRFSAIKTSIAILSVLAFLFVAGPVSADWVSDLPLPDNVTVIGVKFTDDIGTVTIEAMDGKCVQYKVIDNEIAGQRQCGTADWANFVKK